MRRYGKIDDNQRAIVDVLRAHGASVVSLANVGQGVPDLLIGIDGITTIAEIKDGRKKPSAQKLTEDQQRFIETWRGAAVVILRSVDQADKWCRVVRGGRLE